MFLAQTSLATSYDITGIGVRSPSRAVAASSCAGLAVEPPASRRTLSGRWMSGRSVAFEERLTATQPVLATAARLVTPTDRVRFIDSVANNCEHARRPRRVVQKFYRPVGRKARISSAKLVKSGNKSPLR